MINKKVIAVLTLLVIIRIAMAIALIHGFPKKGEYAANFYLADEEEYFKLAFSLEKLNPVNSYRTLGFPILLLPFIWLAKANNLEQLLSLVAIFHACVLAPISIVLVAFIAKKLTQDWKVALLSAAIWTLFPYLVYIFVHTNTLFCQDVPAMRMAHQMWLQALTDPPSTFLILSAILSFLISLDKKSMRYHMLAGIFFGLSILVRPTNIGLVILFLLFYGYNKKLKNLTLFITSCILVNMPQFIYNWHFYGSPFKFTALLSTEKSYAAELSRFIGYPLRFFSIHNFYFFIQQVFLKFSFGFLLLISIILLAIICALFRLYKESPRAGLILSLWIIPYLLIYGSYSDFYNSVLHFLMPIIPAVIIIFSLALRRCLYYSSDKILYRFKKNRFA